MSFEYQNGLGDCLTAQNSKAFAYQNAGLIDSFCPNGNEMFISLSQSEYTILLKAAMIMKSRFNEELA